MGHRPRVPHAARPPARPISLWWAQSRAPSAPRRFQLEARQAFCSWNVGPTPGCGEGPGLIKTADHCRSKLPREPPSPLLPKFPGCGKPQIPGSVGQVSRIFHPGPTHPKKVQQKLPWLRNAGS